MRNVTQREVESFVQDFADSMSGRRFHVHTAVSGPRGYENRWEATFRNYHPAFEFAHQVAQEHLEHEQPFEYVAVRSEEQK